MNNFFHTIYTLFGINQDQCFNQVFPKALLGQLGLITIIVTSIICILFYLSGFMNFAVRYLTKKSWRILFSLTPILCAIITYANAAQIVNAKSTCKTLSLVPAVLGFHSFWLSLLFFFLLSFLIKRINVHTKYIPF